MRVNNIVTWGTKPLNVKWAIIVFMVRLNIPIGPFALQASLTFQRFHKDAVADCFTYVVTRSVLFGVHQLVRPLACHAQLPT